MILKPMKHSTLLSIGPIIRTLGRNILILGVAILIFGPDSTSLDLGVRTSFKVLEL